VDRRRFVEAADRRGIDVETAAALHEDLYGPGPERLREASFAGANGLTRTVQVLV